MKLSERMYKHGDTEDFTSIKAVYKWATEVAQLEAENAALKRGIVRARQIAYSLDCECDEAEGYTCTIHDDRKLFDALLTEQEPE